MVMVMFCVVTPSALVMVKTSVVLALAAKDWIDNWLLSALKVQLPLVKIANVPKLPGKDSAKNSSSPASPPLASKSPVLTRVAAASSVTVPLMSPVMVGTLSMSVMVRFTVAWSHLAGVPSSQAL